MCPMACSDRGNCEDGKCVCQAEWGDVDCSLGIAYLNVGNKYELIVESQGYRYFTTVYETKVFRMNVNLVQGSVEALVSLGKYGLCRSQSPPTVYAFDSSHSLSNTSLSLDFSFDPSDLGTSGLLLSLYNPSPTSSVVSILFTQSTTPTNNSVYVILGVLLGSGALCFSCCLVCLRYLCTKRRTRHEIARVHVYNLSINASFGQDKATFPPEKVKLDPENPQECTICLDTMKEGESLIRLPCSHVFHTNCITAWLEMRNFCCNCKTVLDLTRSYD